MNQSDSADAANIEHELSMLWYLEDLPMNANLVIEEVLSSPTTRYSSTTKELLFVYNGVVIQRQKRGRLKFSRSKVMSIVGEIYARIKKIDLMQRKEVMDKLLQQSSSGKVGIKPPKNHNK